MAGGSTVASVVAEALTTVPGTTIAPEVTTVTTKLAASPTKKSLGGILMPNYFAFVGAFLMGLVLTCLLR